MSSASTKQRVVPDVLKNEPKWSEKLASVAGLLNSKYISPWLQKPLPSSAGSVSASAPAVLYPHVFKLHADGGKIWVFLASPDTYSIWRCSNSDNSGAFQTELVFSGSDMRIMDGCICTSSDGECCYYIVTDMSEGDAKSFVVKKRSVAADSSHEATSTIASAQFSGEIVSISADKRYIALCQIGILKLLCRDSLHVFADIPSIIGIPAVFAASDRWFAVQIAQSNHKMPSVETVAPVDADFNVTARKLVSGAYTLGLAGWERISPIVYQLYKKDGEFHEVHMVDCPKPVNGAGGLRFIGGAVAVFDAVTNAYVSDDSTSGFKENKLSISLNVICKFLAHTEDLELLSFSPSGTMVASASTSGQVVHVHALTSASLLFSASAKSISIKHQRRLYEQTPQLVYRLVRGLSLATIIHISFDSVESMAVVGTSNGTMHLFDLERRNTSSGLGTAYGLELSPILTTENASGKSSNSNGGTGVSFTGSEFSSSAGSAPSSVPLSNIDELLSQFSSQKALDGDDNPESGLKYLKSLIKEVYSSKRMRLASRDYVSHRDGEGETDVVAAKAPAGISYAKAAKIASAVGFTSISVAISVINNKNENSSHFKSCFDSHEIFTMSSQGMLSRYRVPCLPKSQLQNGIGAGAGYGPSAMAIAQLSSGINGIFHGTGHFSGQPVELNRWDLFASLEEFDELNGSRHADSKSSHGGSSPMSVMHSASWLYAFGDIRGGAGNGINPLWTRPQVSFKSRMRQPTSAEKEKPSKKQSQAVVMPSSSSFSFLFPERTACEPIGTLHHFKPAENGAVSILSTISSALDSNSGGADRSATSGRRVASKHTDVVKHSVGSRQDTAANFDDWEVPSETDWALDGDVLPSVGNNTRDPDII